MLNIAKIDLNTIKNNALKVKKLLNGKKLCAVVKADAYGHGAPVVANALYPICDCYAVAILEEAVCLRQSGIDKQILMLVPPFESDVRSVVRYSITASVCDLATLYALQRECEKQNLTCKAHIKFNSGMNRLGVDLNQLKKILQAFKDCDRVILDGVYSHLFNPQSKKDTNAQREKFLLANNLVKGYNNNVTAHLSASGGFLRGEIFDMVRIGILLYGYLPFKTSSFSVQPAMRVYAPVVASHLLDKGEHALYGNFLAKSKTNIDIIRLGYADGFRRAIQDGQFNNRCMDLTALISPKIQDGWVCVMDNAQEIAQKQGTICYEILTDCARRTDRIYIR